ncbi:MAG: hypothetical protein V4669_13680 [Pseudomonadota bacterium]
MKIIRGGSGLGDSLYVRPVAEHYVRIGHTVTVKSDYPEVFAGARVKVEPFTRQGTNVLAHYSSRKKYAETNQWQDVCINSGAGNLPLKIDWQIRNRALINEVKALANHRPIVMVNGGRPPMGRTDGYGNEMLPSRAAFEQVIAGLTGCFVVEVGKGSEVYPLSADLDLSGKTTPADLLDLASVARGLVGQCSFMIPLAEALDKPLMVVWASAGLKSGIEFIRLCAPKKILSKPSSQWVMDDAAPEVFEAAMRTFRAALEI